MAEVVEKSIEDCLDEFSFIRKAKLFNEAEIRDIIRRRRQHEYSLQKRNKRITDFESYVATEIGILRLLSLKRQRLADFRFSDKIEKSIISRLVRLHRSRVDVWIRFINFNRILGRHMSIIRIWDRLLQVHGRTDPRLWAAAAAFHIGEGARQQARCALSKLSVERDALKKANQRVNKLQKSASCSTENMALGLERKHLKRLEDSIARSVRLTWDRVQLTGLREARRLLTTGFSFNEDSVYLLFELLKLEICAADFFVKRVLPRREKVEQEHASNSTTAQSRNRSSRKLLEKGEAVKTDSAALLAEISEDIDFTASGGAVNLVLEQFLTFRKMDSETLFAVLEIVRSAPTIVDKDLADRLSTRLADLNKTEKIEQERIAQQLPKITTGIDDSQTLVDRAVELRSTLDQAGVEIALSLWASWYPDNGVSFRCLDSNQPEVFTLLRVRIEIVLVSHLCRPKLTELPNDDVQAALLAYNKYRVVHDNRVTDARNLLDGLAVSNWGRQCADFWLLFSEFERKLGDCSRLPAIEWRAEKTLEPDALATFHLARASLKETSTVFF